MTETIRYAVDADGIALLTIDLPGKSMNVLTPELMRDLETLVDRVAGAIPASRAPCSPRARRRSSPAPTSRIW